jgi:hypothetical protein
VVLRVGVFRDDDEDASRDGREPGLAGLAVVASGGGRRVTYVTDARGVVTVTLPGPGAYEVSLPRGPGDGNWAATTRSRVAVRVGAGGSWQADLGPFAGLPAGSAPACAFAFGLAARAARAAGVWLPATAAMSSVCVLFGAVLDRRAEAILKFDRVVGGVR